MENIYESSRTLGEYLLFHFGSREEQFPWAEGPLDALDFPRRTVEELIDPTSSIDNALDVGCAVGRSSFVLAELADSVLGVDYSSSFIDAAKAISESGELDYEYHEEADHWKKGKAMIDKIPDNLQFEVGDAGNLRDDLGPFDLVHAANLLCRLPKPQAFLARLTELVSPGGQLLVTTPFTWLEEFTPREHWLGEGDSASALKNILQDSFDLEVEKNLPFLIREHRRKFQYTVALGMRWRRKVT
jgi:putative 4-mercaptohistidine N1-methyltranferase